MLGNGIPCIATKTSTKFLDFLYLTIRKQNANVKITKGKKTACHRSLDSIKILRDGERVSQREMGRESQKHSKARKVLCNVPDKELNKTDVVQAVHKDSTLPTPCVYFKPFRVPKTPISQLFFFLFANFPLSHTWR